MRWELDLLVSALGEHVAVETNALVGLRGIAARAVHDGQAQILLTLTALLRSATDLDYGACESLARELGELLQHQDIVERRAFGSVTPVIGDPVEMPQRVATADAPPRRY